MRLRVRSADVASQAALVSALMFLSNNEKRLVELDCIRANLQHLARNLLIQRQTDG